MVGLTERGYRLIFDHEMQIEVRNTNQDAVESVGMLETLRIKVFITVTTYSDHAADISPSFPPLPCPPPTGCQLFIVVAFEFSVLTIVIGGM
jgi:hypothetical protein